MVVESILKVEVERKPEEMLIFGFIITSLAILLSLWVFPAYASFAMITFTVMAILPFMVKIMKVEKEKQEKSKSKIRVHKDVVIFFMFLFLGMLIAFVLWFLLLPTTLASKLFFLQINTITEINTPTGQAVLELQEAGGVEASGMASVTGEIPGTPAGSATDTALTGAAMSSGLAFRRIIMNNLRILALCILFSFIFGSGAIFILTWNASVLGVAMGNAIKLGISGNGAGSAAYFGAISFALIRYLLHGIPEIAGYFLGGIAGAVISFKVLDYSLGMKKFSRSLLSSLKDSLVLIIGGIILLLLSAGIEVFIAPLFIR